MDMTIQRAVLLAVLLSLPAIPALAADSALPAICTRDAMDMGGGAAMGSMGADEAHKALEAGMAAMAADMGRGMQATDIDVAFVCGMIPHHQGAIDMAKAELQYGDDPWAKEMAQKVIDAQTKEIADMKEWLSRQPQ
jgi:uncharacterized protein (DUF305 family)